MDSSVSLENQIWFLRVCHHVPFLLYHREPPIKRTTLSFTVSIQCATLLCTIEIVQLIKTESLLKCSHPSCVRDLILYWWYQLAHLIWHSTEGEERVWFQLQVWGTSPPCLTEKCRPNALPTLRRAPYVGEVEHSMTGATKRTAIIIITFPKTNKNLLQREAGAIGQVENIIKQFLCLVWINSMGEKIPHPLQVRWSKL